MVYSTELGYDPEEWEECPPPDHFLAFGWFTRLVLAAAAIAFAFGFFWVLERRKSWVKEERRASFAAAAGIPLESLRRPTIEMGATEVLDERMSALSERRRRSDGTPLTRRRPSRPQKRLSDADMAAIADWEQQVKATETRRLDEERQRTQSAEPEVPVDLASSTALKRLLESAVDSPARAPTPPSTPPTSAPQHAELLDAHYERLAAELERKLLDEIRTLDSGSLGADSHQLHAQLYERHRPELNAAADELGQRDSKAAEEFRRRFEDQLDNMVEEYSRLRGRSETGGAQSSQESDAEQFEQLNNEDSPAYFYPSESDDPDVGDAASFTYEAAPQPRHVQSIVRSDAKSPETVPQLYVNDRRVDVGAVRNDGKSSSSSDEGFVKVYVENVGTEQQKTTQPTAADEEQMQRILQEYDMGAEIPVEPKPPQPSENQQTEPKEPKIAEPKKEESPQNPEPKAAAPATIFSVRGAADTATTIIAPQEPLLPKQFSAEQQFERSPSPKARFADIPLSPSGVPHEPPLIHRQITPPSAPSPYLDQPEAPRSPGRIVTPSASRSPSPRDRLSASPRHSPSPGAPPSPTAPSTLLQQQQGPDGTFYPQGPDGQFYKRTRNGYLVPITSELQKSLQSQHLSGAPPLVLRSTDGVIYQRGADGLFYEQTPTGQMKAVTPTMQKVIEAEVEKVLNEGPKTDPSAAEWIYGPDGTRYQCGPLGQFYETGPDGRLHRVAPDIQQQLKEMVEMEKTGAPPEKEPDQSIVKGPDGRIYEEAADGMFYELGPDGRLYRIPGELNTQLHKHREKQRQKREKQQKIHLELHKARQRSSEDTPTSDAVDPDYPYHPKRRPPMQPGPATEKAAADEERRREIEKSISPPPIFPPEEPPRPKTPDPQERAKVVELLSEYDLSAGGSIPKPKDPKVELARDEREHRPSPDAPLHLETDIPAGSTAPPSSLGPESPLDFEHLQMPGEQIAELRSHPQSPSGSSAPPAAAVEPRAATQPPAAEQPKVSPLHRTTASATQLGADQVDDDVRRLAEAEIYLQDAIDYAAEYEKPKPSLSSPRGFVVEEDMLEEGSDKAARHHSADPTSHLIRSTEAFGKPTVGAAAATFEEDADDEEGITYAPEIQSLEIPPDEVSQTSSNAVENLPEEEAATGVEEAQKKTEEPLVPTEEDPLRHRISVQPHQQPLFAAAVAASSPNAVISSVGAEIIIPEEMRRKLSGNEASTPKTSTQPESDQLLLHRAEALRIQGPQPQPKAPQFAATVDADAASVSSRSSRGSTRSIHKQSSLLSALGVTSTQEMLLALPSIEALSDAMRKAGLETTNLIFGIDYTASNKYQGEHSFAGRSLHCVDDDSPQNPYQQVIKIMGLSLAPFTAASEAGIPVYGFGDNESGDWGVFPLNGTDGVCENLDEVLRVYNEVTPHIELSGPTNFAPLIYQAIQICQRVHDIALSSEGKGREEKDGRRDQRSTERVLAHPVTNREPLVCSLCDGDHLTYRCPTFADGPPRSDRVKERKLCRNCLSKDHFVDKCASTRTCRHCSGKHHSSICFRADDHATDPVTKKRVTFASTKGGKRGPGKRSTSTTNVVINDDHEETTEASNAATECTLAANDKASVLLMTTTVNVSAPVHRSPAVPTVAFLDSGSTKSYITTDLAQALNLKPVEHRPLTVTTFGASEMHHPKAKVHQIYIRPLGAKGPPKKLEVTEVAEI